MESQPDDDFTLPVVEVSEQDVVPDAVLTTVQKKRLQMLLGNQIPDRDTMMLMRDITGTAISQKRIDVDKETATGEREAAIAVANAISQIGKNPFRRAAISDSTGDVLESNFKAEPLPAIETVPGETLQEMDVISITVD